MSVFKKTPNLADDQTTNPEGVISPKGKIRGLFASPGTRIETKKEREKTGVLIQRQRQKFSAKGL